MSWTHNSKLLSFWSYHSHCHPTAFLHMCRYSSYFLIFRIIVPFHYSTVALPDWLTTDVEVRVNDSYQVCYISHFLDDALFSQDWSDTIMYFVTADSAGWLFWPVGPHQGNAEYVATWAREFIPSQDALHLWDKCKSTMPECSNRFFIYYFVLKVSQQWSIFRQQCSFFLHFFKSLTHWACVKEFSARFEAFAGSVSLLL